MKNEWYNEEESKDKMFEQLLKDGIAHRYVVIQSNYRPYELVLDNTKFRWLDYNPCYFDITPESYDKIAKKAIELDAIVERYIIYDSTGSRLTEVFDTLDQVKNKIKEIEDSGHPHKMYAIDKATEEKINFY